MVIYDVDEVVLLLDWIVMLINGFGFNIGGILEVDIFCFCKCMEVVEYFSYYSFCSEIIYFFN